MKSIWSLRMHETYMKTISNLYKTYIELWKLYANFLPVSPVLRRLLSPSVHCAASYLFLKLFLASFWDFLAYEIYIKPIWNLYETYNINLYNIFFQCLRYWDASSLLLFSLLPAPSLAAQVIPVLWVSFTKSIFSPVKRSINDMFTFFKTKNSCSSWH